MKRLFFLIPIILTFVYSSSNNVVFGDSEFEINGKITKGYRVIVSGIYSSKDNRCKESDWNTGTLKDGTTFEGSKITYINGRYKAKLYKHIKKNFCNWDIITADISIDYPEKDLISMPQESHGFPTISIEKSYNGYYEKKGSAHLEGSSIEGNVTYIRVETFREDYREHKYLDKELSCIGSTVGDKIYLDSFTKLKRVTLNFDVKKDIYCFTARRSCPTYAKIMYGRKEETIDKLAIKEGYKKSKPTVAHKYKIDKNSNKLFDNMYLDEGDYNISEAKNIIKSNNSYITKPGYAIFQYALAGAFARNEIDFSTIKFLAKHGYNIAKYQQEYYVDKKITSLVKKFDIEEEPWCQGYDYATLPETIKQKLKEKGITLKNYYSKRERKHSLLYDIGGYYNDESPKIIKWMLSQGYRPKKGELEWALFNALYGDIKDPIKLIKDYIALGANLHNPKVAFPLIKTMLWRFDDIKTLKTLVNAGVNINATDQYGQTIIFNHAYNYKPYHGKCNAQIIREYMKLGLDVKHKSKEGKTFIDSDSRGWGCGVKSFKELDENYTYIKKTNIIKKPNKPIYTDIIFPIRNKKCAKILWKCLPESNNTLWQKPLKNGLDSFEITSNINKKYDEIRKHSKKVYNEFWTKHNFKSYMKTHTTEPILISKSDQKYLIKVSSKRFLIELEENLGKEFPGFWTDVPKKVRYRWIYYAMNKLNIFRDRPKLNAYFMVELCARVGVDFNTNPKWKEIKEAIDYYTKSKEYQEEYGIKFTIWFLKNCCTNNEHKIKLFIPKSLQSEYKMFGWKKLQKAISKRKENY